MREKFKNISHIFQKDSVYVVDTNILGYRHSNEFYIFNYV